MILPIYERLVSKYPAIRFCKVDLDKMNYLRRTQSISTLPTFQLFKNGQVIGVETGADEVGQALEEFIQEKLQSVNPNGMKVNAAPQYKDPLVTYL